MFLSVSLYSQFPPPQNFNYQLDYFEMDEWGECNEQPVMGPSYCSHFDWELPDTSLTEAVLESYELYNVVDTDTNLIHSLSDTIYITTTPYAGDLFVLALYSNPSGKSEPSNIVNNPGIPIDLNDNEFETDIELTQDMGENFLIIRANTDLKRIRIINLSGQVVFDERNSNMQIYIGDLKSGVYIIEVEDNNSNYLRKKVLKK